MLSVKWVILYSCCSMDTMSLKYTCNVWTLLLFTMCIVYDFFYKSKRTLRAICSLTQYYLSH